MKQATLAMLAVAFLAASVGCQSLNRHRAHPGGCDCASCDSPGGYDTAGEGCGCSDGQCGARASKAALINPKGRFLGSKKMTGPPAQGPPVGAVSYPYYRTRGPRDFLAGNPPSIGR